jgi:peptidoglycan/LPS O-acetylase OafA/YrhL
MSHAPGKELHSRRIVQLDGIRAFAVGLVFLNHAIDFRLGWAGVDLFFILSGFLITGILLEQRKHSLGSYFRRFYARRARRILPPYVLLLVITLFMYGFWWMRYWGFYYIGMMNFIKITGGLQPHGLEILWSLAVEEQFYLVWPFAVYYLSETVLLWGSVVALFVVPALRWFCTPLFHSPWGIYELTPFRADLLFVGVIFAILWHRRRSFFERFGHYGLVLTVFALGTLVSLSRHYNLSTYANTPFSNTVIFELTLLSAAGIILWALSGRGVGILKLPLLVYLGRISYSVYLIHLTIISYLYFKLPTIPMVLCSITLTLAYAALSWRFLEAPLLGGAKPKEASVLLENR